VPAINQCGEQRFYDGFIAVSGSLPLKSNQPGWHEWFHRRIRCYQNGERRQRA
jgi:hypothetical protein